MGLFDFLNKKTNSNKDIENSYERLMADIVKKDRKDKNTVKVLKCSDCGFETTDKDIVDKAESVIIHSMASGAEYQILCPKCKSDDTWLLNR